MNLKGNQIGKKGFTLDLECLETNFRVRDIEFISVFFNKKFQGKKIKAVLNFLYQLVVP